MGLERRGGGVYFYRSRRSGRAVLKVYAGAGPAAERAAEQAAADRGEQQRARRHQQARLDAIAADGQEIAGLQAAADRAVAAALVAHGWHRVRRQWRRKKGGVMGVETPAGWVAADLLTAAGRLDPAVAGRARAGDRAALAAVDAYLTHPAARALYGDLGRHVLGKWAELYAGGNPVLLKGVLRYAADLRGRLAGPAPTALDALVAERVVLAWLAAGWCDYQLVSQLAELDAEALDAHGRRAERAHRVLLAACRTLAKVRRAGLPDVLAVVSVSLPGTAPVPRQAKGHPATRRPAPTEGRGRSATDDTPGCRPPTV